MLDEKMFLLFIKDLYYWIDYISKMNEYHKKTIFFSAGITRDKTLLVKKEFSSAPSSIINGIHPICDKEMAQKEEVWHWRIFQFSPKASSLRSFSLLPKKTSFGKRVQKVKKFLTGQHFFWCSTSIITSTIWCHFVHYTTYLDLLV